MNASAIDFGFATIRLLTGPNPDSAEPVGVVAWDRSRRWFDVRLLATDEVRRGISSSRLALARVAERDLRNWASDQRVPCAPSSAEPWTGEFWHAVHRFFSSGVRMDAPSAMQRMETPEEEFPLLFDAIARPRTSASPVDEPHRHHARDDGAVSAPAHNRRHPMRMSERRSGALYGAISGPIMSLRIRLSQADVGGAPLNAKQVDAELFRLESAIWREVKNALGITEAPHG